MMTRRRSVLEGDDGTVGDKPRPYGNLCRGGVYPLPFVNSNLAESFNGGFMQKAE